MIVTVRNTLSHGIYTAEITTEMNSVELRLSQQFGEPRVDIAGVIDYTDAGLVAKQFTIAGSPQLRYVRTNMPISFQLDSAIDPEARYKVAGWGTTIKDRVSTVMAALRVNPLSDPRMDYYTV